MYVIKIKTGETIECKNRKIIQNENQASILTFTLLFNSPHFQNLFPFKTQIEVYDLNEKIFDGWVVDIADGMDSTGLCTYEVTCFSVLDYLTRISVGRWAIHPGANPLTDTTVDPYVIYEYMTVDKYVDLILNTYNASTTDDKKIFKGTITVSDNVFCYTNRENCLETLKKLQATKGGYLSIREDEGIYYLDYLLETAEDTSIISLGINMSAIKRGSNLNNLVTRMIPIGLNGLTIESVNGGKNYVENAELIALYGVIETVENFSDITIASNLLSKAQAKLLTINDDSYSIEVSALDLSYINLTFNRFAISQKVNIKNELLKIDSTYRIIRLILDLDSPQKSNLTFSQKPVTTTLSINESVLRTKQLEGNYNITNDKMSISNLQINNLNDAISTTDTKILKQQKYIIMGV